MVDECVPMILKLKYHAQLMKKKTASNSNKEINISCVAAADASSLFLKSQYPNQQEKKMYDRNVVLL